MQAVFPVVLILAVAYEVQLRDVPKSHILLSCPLDDRPCKLPVFRGPPYASAQCGLFDHPQPMARPDPDRPDRSSSRRPEGILQNRVDAAEPSGKHLIQAKTPSAMAVILIEDSILWARSAYSQVRHP